MTRAANNVRISGTSNIPSYVGVSPGWKWWCWAGSFACSPMQSNGRELPFSWARRGTAGSCFGSQREGRVVSTVFQAPTSSKSQASSGIRLTGSKRERERIASSCSTLKSMSYRLNWVVIFGVGTVQYCVWVWWHHQEVDDVVFNALVIFHCGSHCMFRDVCKEE